MSRYIYLILSLNLAGFCLPWQQSAFAQMRPILPLVSDSKRVPLVELGSRDPEFAREAWTRDDSLDLAESYIGEALPDVSRSKGERRRELLEGLLERYVLMSYYYEDVLADRISSDTQTPAASSGLAKARAGVIRVGKLLVKSTKNKRVQARALFHVGVAEYFGTARKRGAIRDLNKIKNLNGYLKRRVQYLTQMDALKRRAKPKQAVAAMRRLLGKLPVAASIAGRLAIGKELGRRSDKSYRKYLWAASTRAKSLRQRDQDSVLSFVVSTWRKAEKKGPWSKPPYPLKTFAHAPISSAIVERSALEDWNKKKFSRALRKYERLAKHSEGKPIVEAFDDRIIRIREAQYRVTKKSRSYELALVNAKKRYRNPNVMGVGKEDKAKKVHDSLDKRHYRLVKNEMNRARKANNARLRANSLALTERFLSEKSERIDDFESLRAEYANLLDAHGRRSEAVATFEELAERSKNNANKRKYYTSAVNSQMKLASWSWKPVWRNGASTKRAQSREKLFALMNGLSETYGKSTNWSLIQQQGLLEIALGRRADAYKRWNAALEKGPYTRDASLVCGYMISHEVRRKNWEGAEKLSRLALAKRLTPRDPRKKNAPINARKVLGDALFEGGLVLLASQRYDEAIKKLAEFNANFKSDPRRDKGLYNLALAYKGREFMVEATDTLIALYEGYPKSKYAVTALIKGGDWSQSSALEEKTLYFHQTFLKRHANHKQARRIRETLLDLLLGRELYAQARVVYQGIVDDKGVPSARRRDAATDLMTLELRHGSRNRAFEASQKLSKLARGNDDYLARAIMVQSDFYLRKKDVKRLTKLAAASKKLSLSTLETREAYGSTHHNLARLLTAGVMVKFFNLELKDPTGTLNKQYSKYLRAAEHLDKVCEVANSYCASSMFKLTRISEDVLGNIEDLQINETLDNKTVNKFNDRKQAIVNTLTRKIIEADEKSLDAVKSGQSLPEQTRQVMWYSRGDDKFHRISGETGNSFVQSSLAGEE